MGKTLYSLMLSEEVVNAVDILAHRTGLTRSALVNKILAEYVSLETPESMINNILRSMESILSPQTELIPFFAPNSKTMSVKSSLAYKYRPTVRYEVDLDPAKQDSMGTLTVVFRTQSVSLINELTEFLRIWVRIENKLLSPITGKILECALYDGKFVRPLLMPDLSKVKSEDIAFELTEYINLFDSCLKAYLSGAINEYGIYENYRLSLNKRNIII